MRYLVFIALVAILIMIVIKACLIYPLIWNLNIDWFFSALLTIVVTILYFYLLSMVWGFLRVFSQFFNLF